MPARGPVPFLNKLPHFFVFEIEQFPAFVNDVELFQAPGGLVHPVLDIDNQREHDGNQQRRARFKSPQFQHHHPGVIAQGGFVRVKVLPVNPVHRVLIEENNHLVQAAADGRRVGIFLTVFGALQERHHIIDAGMRPFAQPGRLHSLQQQAFVDLIQVTVRTGHH